MNLIIYSFLLVKKLASDISSNVNPLIYLNIVVNSIVILTLTTREVRNIISSTKNSSPGWNDIPALVEKSIEYYINPLTHIINNTIE